MKQVNRTTNRTKRHLTAVVGWALCLAFGGLLSGQGTSTNELTAGISASQQVENRPVPNPETHPRDEKGTGNAAPADGRPLTEPTKPTNSFSTFQMIADRNIFNPNRTRRSRSGTGETETPRLPQIDVIALSGTIIYSKGHFAFFDSSASKFRKAVRTGDQIAGYTLKEVQQSHVALERGQEAIQLKVGEQLRREDEGDWQVTSGASLNSSANGSPSATGNEPAGDSSPADPDSNSSSTSSASTGPSDALKRLLEKRRNEQAQ